MVGRDVRLVMLALLLNTPVGRLESVDWRESFEPLVLFDPKEPNGGSDPIDPALSHDPLPDRVGDGLLERLRSCGAWGGI
jgi:hypothetical protein